MLCAAIAAGAGGQSADQVNLGPELQKISGAYGGGFHEVLPGIAGEAGAHEDVEDVVDAEFCLVERDLCCVRERSGQVGVTAVVVLVAGA